MAFTDLLKKHLSLLEWNIREKENQVAEAAEYADAMGAQSLADGAYLEYALEVERLDTLRAELADLESERARYARYLEQQTEGVPA